MTTPTPAYEFFRVEGWGNLFVKIGDGLLSQACEECRRPNADCLCREARRKEMAEEEEQRKQFFATLPRKMTKEEIYANQFTRSEARHLFEFKRPDAAGATVNRHSDGTNNLRFRCYKE